MKQFIRWQKGLWCSKESKVFPHDLCCCWRAWISRVDLWCTPSRPPDTLFNFIIKISLNGFLSLSTVNHYFHNLSIKSNSTHYHGTALDWQPSICLYCLPAKVLNFSPLNLSPPWYLSVLKQSKDFSFAIFTYFWFFNVNFLQMLDCVKKVVEDTKSQGSVNRIIQFSPSIQVCHTTISVHESLKKWLVAIVVVGNCSIPNDSHQHLTEIQIISSIHSKVATVSLDYKITMMTHWKMEEYLLPSLSSSNDYETVI